MSTQIVEDDAPAVNGDGDAGPTEADERWWAAASNAAATDYDVVENEAPELEWPGTREEYERWLDALAPTDDELAYRDRGGDFGHPA